MYYGNDNVGVTSASNFDNTFTKDYSSDAELVGQWNMDEGTGTTITDSSTNSNTGTLGGDGAGDDLPAWAGPPDGGVSGIDGTSVFLDGDSLSFDGTDDYVDCGAENSLHITDAITIELWINATSWNLSDKNVIVTSGNEQYGYMLYQNSGVIQFRLWNNYSSVALAQFTTVQVPVSEWHHLIGVWDGTNISIYLDGILKNTNVGTPPEPNNR